jgi:hypothetical protein
MTTHETMAAVNAAGANASREYLSGTGEVVVARDISHPCGHREDVVLVPSRLGSAQVVLVGLTEERGRDCTNCRFSAFFAAREG